MNDDEEPEVGDTDPGMDSLFAPRHFVEYDESAATNPFVAPPVRNSPPREMTPEVIAERERFGPRADTLKVPARISLEEVSQSRPIPPKPAAEETAPLDHSLPRSRFAPGAPSSWDDIVSGADAAGDFGAAPSGELLDDAGAGSDVDASGPGPDEVRRGGADAAAASAVSRASVLARPRSSAQNRQPRAAAGSRLKEVWSALNGAQRGLIIAVMSIIVLIFVAGLYSFGTTLVGPANPIVVLRGAGDEDATGGLRQPGEYDWFELGGGECLEPFDSVWDERVTVVDCDSPHTAQLVLRGELGADDAEGGELATIAEGPYPVPQTWQSLQAQLCDPAELLDFEAVEGIDDLQFEMSYPGSAAEWSSGVRDYACYATRSAGGELDASVLG